MMKLLFDQNISYRLVKLIDEVFPEAKQITEVGLENCTDRQVWDFAKTNDYCVVTFDSDFFDFSNIYGCPPKVIWLRTGNRKTVELATLLVSRQEIITAFLTNPSYADISCLELYVNS